jgi:hypothetical protein
VLEQAGLLGEVSEEAVEMAEVGALGFRVPNDRMEEVVLALECSGFHDVRAYEVQQPPRAATAKGGTEPES